MLVGTAQADITPEIGGELCGFAARAQPSVGVLDQLAARCVYLIGDDERLLWVHCDLIGLPRSLVRHFRGWVERELGIPRHRVMVSATHTHSGPPTIALAGAGRFDPRYIDRLRRWLEGLASAATAQPEPCDVVCAEGRLGLAVDRRGGPSAHTDPRVGAIGLRRRSDGTFAAAIVAYSMHPVALGSANRHISADWPGRTDVALAARLPGEPVVIVSSGACGNVNPPAEGVSCEQLSEWGGQVAAAVADDLLTATIREGAGPRVRSIVVRLPLDILDSVAIAECARRWALDAGYNSQWGDRYRSAITEWQAAMTAAVEEASRPSTAEAELFLAGIGGACVLGVNGEPFSLLGDLVRRTHPGLLLPMGYCNGLIGYLPASAAYDEGGYEIDVAHMFYGRFRVQRGGLESLARRAAGALKEIG